ncbi:hypothetical protein ACCO45_006996 [Purpureocillium lilacinum]|uniref:Uncharacterized protein n=1 Tax=Purpureocillium lilacinum TaxID=33203 RepID=A0ACC4DR80_PURLI
MEEPLQAEGTGKRASGEAPGAAARASDDHLVPCNASPVSSSLLSLELEPHLRSGDETLPGVRRRTLALTLDVAGSQWGPLARAVTFQCLIAPDTGTHGAAQAMSERAFGACRFPWKARYVHRTRLAATTMDGSLDTVRIRGLNSLIKTSEQAARNRALHQRSPFLGNGVAAQKLQRKVSRYGRRSCASGRHERWARKYTPGTGGTLLSASPEVAPRPEARAATATADTTGRRADGQAARV